jgi:hypothetical protein
MNSVNKETNNLIPEIYFLISNMLAGITQHTEHIVLNTNLIKQMFTIFKFKKQHNEIVNEMIIVCFNALSTGTNLVVLEFIKLKIIDFLAEILYNAGSTTALALKTLGLLINRLNTELYLISMELESNNLINKIENLGLHNNEQISSLAHEIIGLLEKHNYTNN